MNALETALRKYHARLQFHDQRLLDAVIEAAREEEREKTRPLIDAAHAIGVLKALGAKHTEVDDGHP